MPPIINKEVCVKCGICADICPLDVLYAKKENGKICDVLVRYPDECWHCRACEKDCPKHAIRMRYPLSHMMLHMEPKEEQNHD